MPAHLLRAQLQSAVKTQGRGRLSCVCVRLRESVCALWVHFMWLTFEALCSWCRHHQHARRLIIKKEIQQVKKKKKIKVEKLAWCRHTTNFELKNLTLSFIHPLWWLPRPHFHCEPWTSWQPSSQSEHTRAVHDTHYARDTLDAYGVSLMTFSHEW